MGGDGHHPIAPINHQIHVDPMATHAVPPEVPGPSSAPSLPCRPPAALPPPRCRTRPRPPRSYGGTESGRGMKAGVGQYQ